MSAKPIGVGAEDLIAKVVLHGKNGQRHTVAAGCKQHKIGDCKHRTEPHKAEQSLAVMRAAQQKQQHRNGKAAHNNGGLGPLTDTQQEKREKQRGNFPPAYPETYAAAANKANHKGTDKHQRCSL